MPFLLRCWLISSIGEDPTLVRSRWAKEEAPPAREVQAGLYIFSEYRYFYAGGLTHEAVFFFSSQVSVSKRHDPLGIN